MVDATVMFEDTAAVLATLSHRNAVCSKDCGCFKDVSTTQSSAGLLTWEHLGQGDLVAAMKLENLSVFLVVEGSECSLEMCHVEL